VVSSQSLVLDGGVGRITSPHRPIGRIKALLQGRQKMRRMRATCKEASPETYPSFPDGPVHHKPGAVLARGVCQHDGRDCVQAREGGPAYDRAVQAAAGSGRGRVRLSSHVGGVVHGGADVGHDVLLLLCCGAEGLEGSCRSLVCCLCAREQTVEVVGRWAGGGWFWSLVVQGSSRRVNSFSSVCGGHPVW
jgi:hypothetical protein